MMERHLTDLEDQADDTKAATVAIIELHNDMVAGGADPNSIINAAVYAAYLMMRSHPHRAMSAAATVRLIADSIADQEAKGPTAWRESAEAIAATEGRGPDRVEELMIQWKADGPMPPITGSGSAYVDEIVSRMRAERDAASA